jgi:glycosyltransferase involved in cell wall biosynthesis
MSVVKSHSPAVSIGLPIYNGEAHIGRALESILQQDFDDFEVIVSDNASTDATATICLEYARQDSRIRFHQNPSNIGAGPNHNLVFGLARGRFFAWAAHDVEFLPGMLRRCFDVISQASDSTVLVYPRCEMRGDDGVMVADARYSIDTRSKYPEKRMATVVRHVAWVTQLYGLVRADVLRQTRLLGSFAYSDYVLLAELALLGEIWELPFMGTRRWLDPLRGAAQNVNASSWAAWLDSSRRHGSTWLSTRERLAVEYARSAWRIPRGAPTRIRCLLYGPGSFYWRILLRASGPLRRRLSLSSTG